MTGWLNGRMASVRTMSEHDLAWRQTQNGIAITLDAPLPASPAHALRIRIAD